MLQAFVLTHLGWIYGEEAFPSFESFSEGDFGWAKGKESVALNLKLWRVLSESRINDEKPCHRDIHRLPITSLHLKGPLGSL